MVASLDGAFNYKELRQTYEELSFLLRDLAREGDQIAITTPRPVIRKVVERLLFEAEEIASEIDVIQPAEENTALLCLCKSLLTDITAVESRQRPELPALSPAERLAQREIVVTALEALPSHLTAEQIIAERLPYNDCDESEFQQALSVIVDLGILELGSAGVIVPSDGLVRINELWEDLCAAI